MQIPNPDLDFWNSDPKIHFWANLDWKSKSCPFFLKIGTHGILMMLILIPTLVFWISDPKSIFGKIWAKKVKVVQFGWKLAHRVSWQCWFLFRHYFSQFPTNLGRKIQSYSFWLKIGTHGILRMLILIPTIVFWTANPKPIFGQIWTEKVKAVCFAWKLAHKHIHTQYLEDVDSYFDISFLKFQT